MIQGLKNRFVTISKLAKIEKNIRKEGTMKEQPEKKKQDKRVIKAKKNLEDTLVQLLTEKPFEKITVTELCERAQTSRITFYYYYEDKYDLLNDFYTEMDEAGSAYFNELQEKNNPDNDALKSYENMLKTAIEKYRKNASFFMQMNPFEANDLWTTYGTFVFKKFSNFEKEYNNKLVPKYPIRQFTIFMITGFWGYLLSGVHDGRDLDQMEKEVLEIMENMINSPLFEKH